MQDFAAGRDKLPKILAQFSAYPCAAANLCHNVHHGASPEERASLDTLFELAIARLVESRGDILNRFLQPK